MRQNKVGEASNDHTIKTEGNSKYSYKKLLQFYVPDDVLDTTDIIEKK